MLIRRVIIRDDESFYVFLHISKQNSLKTVSKFRPAGDWCRRTVTKTSSKMTYLMKWRTLFVYNLIYIFVYTNTKSHADFLSLSNSLRMRNLYFWLGWKEVYPCRLITANKHIHFGCVFAAHIKCNRRRWGWKIIHMGLHNNNNKHHHHVTSSSTYLFATMTNAHAQQWHY